MTVTIARPFSLSKCLWGIGAAVLGWTIATAVVLFFGGVWIIVMGVML